MSEPEQGRIPEWAERERFRDLAWIVASRHVFWPAVQAAYEAFGRGAVTVDTTVRPTGEGYPIWYVPQELVEHSDDSDAIRMVAEYDPTWEMVTILLKTQDRVSVYRVGVPGARVEAGGE